MNEKFCKKCNSPLNDENAIIHKTFVKGKLYIGTRRDCKKCRSQSVMEYNKNNPKRKEYINKRAREIGLVKESPCETCQVMCYKKYAKAFCSIKCRFVSYIKKTENCWIWIGSMGRRGYGKFSFDKENKYMPAHRSSYILFNGEIPESMYVCHTCDNPSCVNPSHLWVGTPKDNTQDCIKKGRFPVYKKRIKHATI